MDKSFLNLLWIPDIFIYNSKNVVKKGMLGEIEALAYKPISKCHFLTYMVTLNVEIVCHRLNFDEYPFDSNQCFFEMGSYTYPKEELIVTQLIKGNDIYYNHKGFLCSDYLIDLENFPMEKNETKFGYSKTGFQMTLQRYFVKYIFDYYIPSGLMAITSWVR